MLDGTLLTEDEIREKVSELNMLTTDELRQKVEELNKEVENMSNIFSSKSLKNEKLHFALEDEKEEIRNLHVQLTAIKRELPSKQKEYDEINEELQSRQKEYNRKNEKLQYRRVKLTDFYFKKFNMETVYMKAAELLKSRNC